MKHRALISSIHFAAVGDADAEESDAPIIDPRDHASAAVARGLRVPVSDKMELIHGLPVNRGHQYQATKAAHPKLPPTCGEFRAIHNPRHARSG